MTILGSGLLIPSTLPSGDPYAANVVLLLKGDGTNGSTNIVDSSPSPKTITRFGDTQISTVQSKYGGSSLAFDGDGDYLTVPSSTNWDFTGDFTIETWVRFASYPSSYNGSSVFNLIGTFSESPGTNWYLGVLGSSSSLSSIYLYTGSINISVSYSFSLNTWYHVAVSRHGSALQIFVNGISLGNFINTSALKSQSQVLWLGALNHTVYRYFLNGYINSLRVTQGIARYTANFNPETDTYLT